MTLCDDGEAGLIRVWNACRVSTRTGGSGKALTDDTSTLSRVRGQHPFGLGAVEAIDCKGM